MTNDDIEVYAYSILARSRGGQQCGSEPGIIVIHRATGIAVVDRTERSQVKGRIAALQKLEKLLQIVEDMDDDGSA